MADFRKAVGNWGEEVAHTFLVALGYKHVARNVRTDYGEIDLILQDGETLVFVEVKTRRTDNFGSPAEAITARKFQKMTECAEAYLQLHGLHESNWRLDVVAVYAPATSPEPRIEHIQNVQF